MLHFYHMIAIVLSIYNVSSAGKFTRQCMSSNGRCGRNKDSNCESMFGSRWTVKGRCCKKRPCCVFQCEDFQSDSLPNGMVNVTERNFGSTANFSCNEGYILEGKQSITCLQSGWNGEIPQCRFQCADIQSDSLPNGMVTLMERNVGSTANFSCNEGYLLDGNHSIACTQSGWNGQTPQCLFQCEDILPDSLTNGTVTVSERHIGSTANFSCDAGHTLNGNESITCTPLGWNGSIPQCRLYILCPETTVDFRGSKYIFHCYGATWSDSEANCNSRAGHLTSIGTGDENSFLLDVIKLMKDILKIGGYFWIGLTDNNDDMSYKWLSGKPLNYSDWYQGSPQQPDNLNFVNQPGAHCALIDEDYFLHWSDELCESELGSICEIRLP